MGDIGQKIVGGIAAIISLAVVALVISSKANTPNVLNSFFGGLSNLIGVAISPVTGQTVAGLNAGQLTGDTGTWTVPVNNQIGTTSTLSGGGNLLTQGGNLLTGAGNLVTGAGNLTKSVNQLFGGSGGSGPSGGGGFVDSGSFDGGFSDGGAFVDSVSTF
jgi:hypothetical protein